jgi:Flp pilus assembly protein protease CpaA
MQEYYFLFALAFIWTLFATIQDLKTREVANWLNFSLIAFALAYRAFYASTTHNAEFFLFGLFGFIIFFALGNLFYYTKAFAGGDAKLLMGMGIILPYTNYFSLIALPLLFILVLFSVGALYSLIYSIFIVAKNKNKFLKELTIKTKNTRNWLLISGILFFVSLFIGLKQNIAFAFSIIFLIPIVYVYTKTLDKCMIILTPPNKLTEGDWLEEDTKLPNKKIIKKSVHGLSKEDIQLLKKYNVSIKIKQGIPFVPAFLITIILTALFFLISKLPLSFSLLG